MQYPHVRKPMSWGCNRFLSASEMPVAVSDLIMTSPRNTCHPTVWNVGEFWAPRYAGRGGLSFTRHKDSIYFQPIEHVTGHIVNLPMNQPHTMFFIWYFVNTIRERIESRAVLGWQKNEEVQGARESHIWWCSEMLLYKLDSPSFMTWWRVLPGLEAWRCRMGHCLTDLAWTSSGHIARYTGACPCDEHLS